MTIASTAAPTPRKPLRLWPGVAAAALAWVALLIVPVVVPTAAMYGILGGAIAGLLVVLWWLLFSRAAWIERLGAVALLALATFVTSRMVHPSVLGAGMGMLFFVYAIPVLGTALVVWAVATRRLAAGPRRTWLVAAIVVACIAFTLVRIDGLSNTSGLDVEWRWTPTVEERLLAEAGEDPVPPPLAEPAPQIAPAAAEAPLGADGGSAAAEGAQTSADTASGAADSAQLAAPAADRPPALAAAPLEDKTENEWPGFRGPQRDGVVHGVRIETDWSKSPPIELWHRAVGPGWSSFAVHGNRVYTQEQLGEDEIVSCYDLDTGQPVWRHRDATRFWEANAGAGPRATPTLDSGRVYTFGATGILNALDARDGSVVWSRNAAADTKKEVPYWGFAGSPLVVGDTVIVAASGALAAYDIATGEPRWFGPAEGAGYSSPHLATLDGVDQILLLNGAGAISVSPSDGTLLWKHDWSGDGIVQPAVTEDGDVLIGTGSGMGGEVGMRRVAVARGPGGFSAERGTGGWTVEERWTTVGLKPYFNDFVVHQGHAYGFDGGILACVDLEDGARKWKGGRYGDGQLVLLADQDLLLVLSERGELALVGATPDRFVEHAKAPAIEGKTWNHPAVAGDVLLVRNSEEMAAFRLARAAR
jgi:outer membrane protein assembly factor BamB